MKQITINGGGQPLTLTHGMKELVALSKLTGQNLLQGEHWLSKVTMENIGAVLHILAQRAHPDLTEDQLLDTLPGEALTEFLEKAPELVGVKQEDPLPSSGSSSVPSAASPSGSSRKK